MRKLYVWLIGHRWSSAAVIVAVVCVALVLAGAVVRQGALSFSAPPPTRVGFLPTEAPPPTSYSGQGVAFGIQAAPDTPFWWTYRVPLDAPFHGILQVTNHQPAQSFLLTCLLDYQQVPCSFGGQPVLTKRISLGANELRDIPFATPTLSQGWHDFTLLVIPDPDDQNLDTRYRLGTDTVYAARTVLLDGGLSWSPPRIAYPDISQAAPNRSLPLDGIFIDDEAHPPQLQAWTVQHVTAGVAVPYDVHLGNKSSAAYTFALLALLDYHQVPLSSQGQRAVFGTLAAGGQGLISGLTTAPMAAGVHELMVLWVENPYHALEYPSDGPQRQATRLPVRIESSLRVAIVTDQP